MGARRAVGSSLGQPGGSWGPADLGRNVFQREHVDRLDPSGILVCVCHHLGPHRPAENEGLCHLYLEVLG